MSKISNSKDRKLSVMVDIINKENIPKSFYLVGDNKSRKIVFKFYFSNNFEYYYCTNNTYVNASELIDFIKTEYFVFYRFLLC